MTMLQEFIGSMTVDKFKDEYLYRQPLVSKSAFLRLQRLVGWPLIYEILVDGYDDCWLPLEGRLPTGECQADGRLGFMHAMSSFEDGRTVLIRHAEKTNTTLKEIALEFQREFEGEVDIQLYATPAGAFGFDWHYDLEDVFIVQSTGSKEFYLRQARNAPDLRKVNLTMAGNFAEHFAGPELRCLLNPGDALYIPAGIWHKALAITHSFHASIGVLPQGIARRPHAKIH